MNFKNVSLNNFSYNSKYNLSQNHVKNPIKNTQEKDMFLSASESKNTNDDSKKNKLKTALKVIGVTTLSIASGLLIYKYTKGKNLKQLAGLGNKGKTVNPMQAVSPQSTATILNETNTNGVKSAAAAINGKTTQVSQSATAEMSEISRIRTGIKGRIRTGEELTNKDIATLFESQIMNTKPEEIKKIISSFAKEDQELAKKVLKEMTQFGNMQSLDDIAANLDWNLYKKEIYVDSKNSLAQTLKYLVSSKDSFGPTVNAHTMFTKTAKNCVMLLDDIMIQNLENSPALRKLVKNNIDNIKFISPEGWVSGINPFNQTNDMGAMVKELLTQVKTLKTQNPLLTEQQAIESVLRKPVVERLEKMGLGNSVEFFKNTKSIVDTNSKYFPDLVANQLNQKTLSEQEIQKIINKYHKDYHPYIRELIANGCDINSPKSLSL